MGKRYKTSETTCQAISGALKQLMTQKPLERITVAEIMDTCGMRRQHFYYYFTDIYDLLRWTFEKEALELLQQQQGVSPGRTAFCICSNISIRIGRSASARWTLWARNL